MKDKIEDTLEDREKIYGNYKQRVHCRAVIMNALKDIHIKAHGSDMRHTDAEYLHDIVNKLTRLASSPKHKDSWHDIAGYATLVEKGLG